MICKLPCCISPVKPVKELNVSGKKKGQVKYQLPYTSLGERQTMSVLHNIGKSTKEVADILNCSQRTVQRQIKKLKEKGSFADKDKSGRPKKLTAEMENQLIAWVEEDRRTSSPKLKTLLLEQFGVDVNERTIRVVLKKKGFLVVFVQGSHC
jgi:transposase